MRVAIVVDWLTVYAGAERVVEQIFNIYPDADLFALVDFLESYDRHFIKDKTATTSFIQKLPFARTKYRSYLPLMPMAIEQLDVTGYDLVISSSHAVAKGVITRPGQIHVCYIHSPIRYAWDLQHQYLKESGLEGGVKSFFARWVLHYLRSFDVRSANGVDQFVANSEFVRRRVQKYYRRDASVVNPPVSVDHFDFLGDKEDFYVTASRMVPYKKMDLIAEAFSHLPDKRLVIIGDGPDFEKIKRAARNSSNIEFKGYLPFNEMRNYMQSARAFVFAAEEDFGITPVEAMACGTPVIAFGKGGALETVLEGRTGTFFPEQTCTSLISAINDFERKSQDFDYEGCRKRALEFSSAIFRERFKAEVDKAISKCG